MIHSASIPSNHRTCHQRSPPPASRRSPGPNHSMRSAAWFAVIQPDILPPDKAEVHLCIRANKWADGYFISEIWLAMTEVTRQYFLCPKEWKTLQCEKLYKHSWCKYLQSAVQAVPCIGRRRCYLSNVRRVVHATTYFPFVSNTWWCLNNSCMVEFMFRCCSTLMWTAAESTLYKQRIRLRSSFRMPMHR